MTKDTKILIDPVKQVRALHGRNCMNHKMFDSVEAQVHQLVVMQQDGNLVEALAGYELIVEALVSYENQGHDKKIGEIRQYLLETQLSPALKYYIKALDFYYRRQYQHAYKAVESAILLAPDIEQLHLFKARVLDAFGNTKEAATVSDSNQEALFMLQAESEMPGMDYYGWLEHLHELLQPATYVEIGLGDGRAFSLTGPNAVAIGIDPYKGKWELLNYGSPHGSSTLFHLTSDDFFSQNDLKEVIGKDTFDLAFIDGLHYFDQVLKDFINLERYAGKNSMILMHDCLPVSPKVATRERNTAFWTGDVWRIIPCLKTFRPDLNIITLPTKPSGLTLVTDMDPTSQVLSENYEAIVKYYAGLNLPTSRQERFSLLNVHQCTWDEFAERIIASDGKQQAPAASEAFATTSEVPRVSVINVICGDNIEFMGKCMNSLISNTDYPNVEFIIVTNSGKEIENYVSNLAKNNPAIKCVFRNNRHSNASNRNIGAAHASPDSKYYLFADSDVMYSDDQWLRNLVNVLEENAEIGMIGGGDGNTLGHYCFIDENKGILIHFINYFEEDLVQNYHVEMMIIPGYNMLIRREIYTAIAGWDEGFTPVYGEDTDICLRCILAGYKVHGIHNKGVHHLYRNTKENNSSELLPSDDIQFYLTFAAVRRLALKYEGILPTKQLDSFQAWFNALKNMRENCKEYSKHIKALPPTVLNGKINNLYLPLLHTEEISKIYHDISFNN